MSTTAAPIAHRTAGVEPSGYAVVRAAVAPMLAEPHISTVQVSQQLAGHRVAIVEMQDDWVLARGRDDYPGWIHRGYLGAVEPAASGPDDATARRVSLGCVVADARGVQRALPLRALLDDRDRVVSGEAIDERELAARFPGDARAIAATAVARFVGASYQWGGVTPWGCDCSGLVQSSFALHGVIVPRDAWQQARAGVDAGRDPLRCEVADLLFFSDRPDGHVTHVAIAIGDGSVVHLALGRGGYAVERMHDVNDAYVAGMHRRFLFARRVL